MFLEMKKETGRGRSINWILWSVPEFGLCQNFHKLLTTFTKEYSSLVYENWFLELVT